MAYKAPRKHYHKGITMLELQRVFLNEEAARKWFENAIWLDGEPHCPHCGGNDTYKATHKAKSYRCRPCKRLMYKDLIG